MATVDPGLVAAPTPVAVLPQSWSLADLARHLDVPLDRVRLFPSPGTATEDDLVRLAEQKVALCELVDGVLVEKVMGQEESTLATLIARSIWDYLDQHPSGRVIGADGAARTLPGKVRMPDVAYISDVRYESSRRKPVLHVAPDLAVEVLSPSNTASEMNRKTTEYFSLGTKLVWIIDPATRTAKAYRSATDFTDIPADGELDGGDVLPGFTLPLAPLLRRVYGE